MWLVIAVLDIAAMDKFMQEAGMCARPGVG